MFLSRAGAFASRMRIGNILVNRAIPYQKISSDTSQSLLVLGDSTGVGVGARRSEESVAGRFGSLLKATYVENLAVSGACVSDLASQVRKAKLPQYGTILVQIGANDVIRFHNVSSAANELDKILASLPPTQKVFLMLAGNVGAATMFPHLVRPWHARLTLAYHAAFQKVAMARGATYVNLYTSPEHDPFVQNPERYFSADGLHPSSEGYQIWYEMLARESILKK